MNDQYGRRIDYMRVSVTDRCNLRCVYCMPGEGFSFLPHEDILSFEEIERVCRIGVRLGITKIKLTGGEPLVRRGIPDLVGKLKGIPGIDEVTLTTNGILLKEQINELVSNGLASAFLFLCLHRLRALFRFLLFLTFFSHSPLSLFYLLYLIALIFCSDFFFLSTADLRHLFCFDFFAFSRSSELMTVRFKKHRFSHLLLDQTVIRPVS